MQYSHETKVLSRKMFWNKYLGKSISQTRLILAYSSKAVFCSLRASEGMNSAVSGLHGCG
jgi:hypothetical protein